MPSLLFFFFFNDTATTEIYTLSLHDALPISIPERVFEIAAEAKALDLTLDLTRPRAAARRAVERALGAVAEAPTAPHVAAATALIEGANRLGLHYGHWAAQNRFFELWGAHPEARTTLRPLAAALGFELPA